MKQVMQYALALFCMACTTSIFAQTDSTTTQEETPTKSVQFKIGTYYNSNLNYYGRTDSLRSSGVFPMAELWINNHFYLNAAPIFVNNDLAKFQYAGTVATVGYMFNDQKKWAGNFFVVKPIYQDNSELVQSALKAQLAGSLTSLNKIINITVGGDIKWSGRTDYGANAGLDHIFRKKLSEKSVLVIDPSAYIYAGTQQFSNVYYQKQGTIPLLPAMEKKITDDVKKFNILAYELSSPVILGVGKFQFLLIPSYILPENLMKVEGRPDLSESGENTFYVTAGAKVTF